MSRRGRAQDLAGYVNNAVLVEGRSIAEVCEAHGISRSWLYELIARYRQQGGERLRPQSKRPQSSPTRVSASIEDEIVALRKELNDSVSTPAPSRARSSSPRRCDESTCLIRIKLADGQPAPATRSRRA
jgi:transposase